MIRQGRIEDAARMAEIFNHYVRTSTVIFSNNVLSADDMRRRLESVVGRFPFLVWEENGRVSGYCYAHFFHPDAVYSQTCELTEYLDHSVPGRGTVTRLLSETLSLCREAGAHTLLSFITAGNSQCEKMVGSLGFEKCGQIREAGYKFGQYLDDVIYQLIL